MKTANKLFTILTLLALTLALTPLQAAHAAGAMLVNGDADTVADDGLCTLREAMTNANADSQLYATTGECAAGNGTDTITFAADYTITLVDNQLPAVTTPIILNGNGAAKTIIQANAAPQTAAYRVFEVGDIGNLTLDGLTVRNGNSDNGGGIYNAGTLTVSNVTISANYADHGGGMYNSNSNPTLTNVTFNSNHAYTNAMMASAHGGGMYNNNSNPTLTNVTFNGNYATAMMDKAHGGGMYNNNSNPTLTNVTFSGNSAPEGGGGMYNNNSSPTLTNVTISDNSAIWGGGMYNNSSNPTLTNVTFSANRATSGGGMHNNNSSPTLTNTIIADSISGGDCYTLDMSLNAASSNNLIEGTGGNACGLTNGVNGNIIGHDPNLDATLQDNGGSTFTHALLAGSPAINAGNNATCAATDQRGNTRAGNGANCDIGAYEYLDSVVPTVVSIVRTDANPTSAATVNFTVTFSEPVTDVDAADFKLANAVLMGASIVSVTPVSTSVYTVTISTDQNGIIRLDVPATTTIIDAIGNALTQPYSSGQTYTVSKGNAPTVPVLKTPANNALVTNTPTLDWNDSSQVMALAANPWSYEVNITALGGYNETFNTAGNADPLLGLGISSLTIQPADALPANTTFYWKVRAYNDQNQYSAWSLTRAFKTPLATPELNVPANSSTVNNTRPDFEWDSVDGAVSYTLQIFKKNPKTGLFTVLANTGTIKAPAYTYTPKVDLLPNTEYQWRVKANGTNQGSYSAVSIFTTSVTPPTIPVLVSPANGSLVLSTAPQTLVWKASTNTPLGYEVEYANNSIFSGATFVSSMVAAPTVQLPIGVLLPGRTYYWRVRSWSTADTSGIHSAWSAVRTIKVKFVEPTLTSPANGATGISRTAPTFTWNSGSNGLWTSYTIDLATTPPTATKFIVVKSFTVPSPSQTYTAALTVKTQLLGNKTYYWRVRINGLYMPIFSTPTGTGSWSFTTAP